MNRRQEIRRWLALRRREGLTYRELSQRSSIPSNTLSHWAWRLRREAEEGAWRTENGPAFVEVAAASSGSDAERVEVVLRGERRLVVPTSIEPETLARLVAALERC